MDILVKFFEDEEGKLYCLDVNSSAVFEIDEMMRDTIQGLDQDILIRKYGEDSIQQVKQNFEELKRHGFFSIGNKKEEILKQYNFTKVDLLSVSLMISNSCNMNCTYCFNEGGTIPEDSEVVMNFDVAKAAIDYLVTNSSRETVGVDFFGGEPLFNFELIKKVIDYCKKQNKKWQFSLITNGTILNEDILTCFKQNNFHVVVSYDSVLQDEQRSFAASRKSNREIVRENIRKLVEVIPRTELSIRCILTHNMIPHIEEVIQEAKELGVRVLFGPVTLSEGNILNLTERDYADYLRMIKQILTDNYEHKRYNDVVGVTSISNIVLQLLTGKQKYYSCGIGTDQVGVSATGKIYPCHRFIGVKGFSIGDVFEGIDTSNYRRFAERFVDNMEKCTRCWAKYFCGGGCAHESYVYENNLFVPASRRCQLCKNEIEIGLKMYVKMLKENKLESIKKYLLNNDLEKESIETSGKKS